VVQKLWTRVQMWKSLWKVEKRLESGKTAENGEIAAIPG
jgi:hypothetical protein